MLGKSYTIKIEINRITVGTIFGFSNPKKNIIKLIKKMKKKLEDGRDMQTELFQIKN
jgi:hypothetical protein